MNPRAQALARILISRVRQFDRSSRDGIIWNDPKINELRNQLVEKVLFSEVGLTDYAKARLVATAMPRVRAEAETADRDLGELAEFLATHLDWAALNP